MNRRQYLFPVVAAALASLALSGSVLAAGAGSPGFVLTTRAGQPAVHDLVVEPGANPSELQLHFAGADRVSFNLTGGLDIMNADGSLWHYKPEVYQVINGKRRAVVVGYHILDKDRVSLRVRDFDPSTALVVGPVAKQSPKS